jgi:hypothetical protein
MSVSKLWAILILGPDDVFAMESESAAYTAADEHNSVVKAMGLGARFNMTDEQLAAQVIEWPHSAESHAESLTSGEAETMCTTNGNGIPDRLFNALQQPR